MARIRVDDDHYSLTDTELIAELAKPDASETWNQKILREAIRRILVRLVNG